MIWLLLIGLIAVFVGGLLSLNLLLGSGVVLCITLLTALKCRPRRLALFFGVWLEAVIVYLLAVAGDATVSWLGLPRPAFWMLLGIWLLPVLVWPLGFAISFKHWMDRE